jgi:uncharacterized protein YbjT (DUF2867 family)
MITVMGATGHVGGRIVELLLASGERIRALGRSAEKLAGVAAKGAAVLTGDAADAGFLTKAFRDADAAFTLLPPDVHASDYRRQQDAQGEAIVTAIRDGGLRYVVFLSSLGGELPEGTGPIAGLHAQEERLRRLPGVNVLILRPTYFFENFFDTLGLIKHQGINGGAIAPDLPFPLIATCDIADIAADGLRRRDWRGVVVRELLGERAHLRGGHAHHRRTDRQGGSAICAVSLHRLHLVARQDRDFAERGRAVRRDGTRDQ